MSGLRLNQGGTAHVYLHAPHHEEELTMTLGSVAIAALMAGSVFSTAFPGFLHAQDLSADVNRGKMVYERHCLACHGVHGYGDGPEAVSLTVAPSNFQRYTSFFKSDEDLLRTIEHGVVFSPMHSWQGRLTEGEMQDVVA